jgi:hypothetical protein
MPWARSTLHPAKSKVSRKVKALANSAKLSFFRVLVSYPASRHCIIAGCIGSFLPKFMGRILFSHVDGRPCLAKVSVNDVKQMKIAGIGPDFRSRLPPLSLMEFAGRFLISLTSFKRPVKQV